LTKHFVKINHFIFEKLNLTCPLPVFKAALFEEIDEDLKNA
jgi:hypothetical protein